MRSPTSRHALLLAALLLTTLTLCSAASNTPITYDDTDVTSDIATAASQANKAPNKHLHSTDTAYKPIRTPAASTWGLLAPSENDRYLADVYFGGRTYIPEFLAIGVLVIYALNYFVGRVQNKTIAQKLYLTYRLLLEQQFYSVGLSDNERNTPQDVVKHGTHENSIQNERNGVSGGLLVDNTNRYRLFASGRTNCHSLLLTFNLFPRSDLLQYALNLFTSAVAAKDTITVEIPLNAEQLDPYVVLLVKQKKLKQLKKSYKDIDLYGSTQLTAQQFSGEPSLPPSFVVVTDQPTVVKSVINSEWLQLLHTYEKSIEYVHISDQSTACHSFDRTTQSALRVSFTLPNISDKAYSNALQIVQTIINLVDTLPSIRLTPQQKSKAQQIRADVERKALKEAKAKEEADKKAERLEQLQSGELSQAERAAEQRRLDKREAKKSKTRGMKIVKG